MLQFKKMVKEKMELLFDGEITLLKTDFWLAALVIFLLGVLYGLMKAPLTHGITVSCGNNNGNTWLPDDLEEDTPVSLKFDKALLYKNMVGAEADWLYGLPQWEKIFDEETRKALYKEQKSSTTIVKEQKIYPNDPCPCGSGKK